MVRRDASSMQVVITERLPVLKNRLVFHIIWDYTDADELVRNSCLSDWKTNRGQSCSVKTAARN